MSKTDPSGFQGSFLQVSLTESSQSLPVWANNLQKGQMAVAERFDGRTLIKHKGNET